jgi:hypothetical protein
MWAQEQHHNMNKYLEDMMKIYIICFEMSHVGDMYGKKGIVFGLLHFVFKY